MNPREVPTKTVKVRRKLKDEAIAATYRELLGGKGRSVTAYWAHRASESFMFETTISDDPLEMAWREGQRAAFIRDYTLAGLTLADVAEMMETVGDWE